jgi:hypothetical protein
MKHYSTVFQKAEILKCLLPTVPGVHTLECLQTNLVLNGWWALTENTTVKYKRTKQRTPNIRFCAIGA